MQGTVHGKEFSEGKVIRIVLLSTVQRKKGDSGDSVVTHYGICSLMLIIVPLLLLLLLLLLPVCGLFIILYLKQTMFVGNIVLLLLCG